MNVEWSSFKYMTVQFEKKVSGRYKFFYMRGPTDCQENTDEMKE